MIVLCNNGTEETLLHLFFQCPLALACWNLLQVTPVDSDSFFWEHRKHQVSTQLIYLYEFKHPVVLDNLDSKK